MDTLITPVPAMNHCAVKRAARRFFEHIKTCSMCDLREERLCSVGVRLREEHYKAAAMKWRR